MIGFDWLGKAREGVLVCDGAMGTTLQLMGLPAGTAPETWNLERPEAVEAVHRSYVEAGAELVQTNSIGANSLSLDRHGLAGRVAELNRAGVEIARRAAGGKAAVLGDVGPTGRLLKPYGDLEPERVQEAFAQQIGALVGAGADGLILETFVALEEAVAAVRAAKASANVPVICSMAFGSGGRTVMGVTGGEAARALLDEGADVVGANCGSGPEDMFLAIEQMREEARGALLIAQPNAGVPRLVGDKTVFSATPEEMARWAAQFVDMGVNIVGSCCGSTHLHTAAIARAVKGWAQGRASRSP